MRTIRLSKISFRKSVHTQSKKVRKKVILENGLIPHLKQFGQVYIGSGSVIPEHRHSGIYEIFLIEKGKVEFLVNRKSIFLKKGDMLVVEPEENHKLINKSQETAVILFFETVQ